MTYPLTYGSFRGDREDLTGITLVCVSSIVDEAEHPIIKIYILILVL